MALYVVSSGGPRICGVQARGSEPGRLQASSKIENSVDTTGSNNWYQTQGHKLDKKLTNLRKVTGGKNHPDV